MLRRSTLLCARAHYDVCCIGAGPASIAAAMRCYDFGKKVCIVEQGRVGGKDVWAGTMESKALWEISKFSAQCRGSSFRRCYSFDAAESAGAETKSSSSSPSQSSPSSSLLLKSEMQPASGHGDSVRFTPSSLYGAHKPDFCVTRRTIQEMCCRREQQILQQLSVAKIDILKGKATFASPYELKVYNNDGGTFDSVTADYFIVATGSRSRRPPQFKPDGVHILNSEQILSHPFPNSLLIIGSGSMGSEWAAIYSNLGTTKVTLLERDQTILPRTDPDIRDKVKALYAKKNVRIIEGMELHTLRVENNIVRYAARDTKTGEVQEDTVEKALICLGRTPNYEALGLENLPGSVVQNGRIITDKFGRVTPYRHVYVAGDAAGGKTVRAAETQGRSVVEHMFEFRPQSGVRFSDTHETQIMFLDQEVATVGWSETVCRERAVAYRVSIASYRYVARALALNNTKGHVKVIVTNDRQQKVLGVSAVGAHASSIVEIASPAVQQQAQVCQFDALFVAYPAIAECFQEAARALRGSSMLKPGSMPGIEIRSWEPDRKRGRGYTGSEAKAALMSVGDKS